MGLYERDYTREMDGCGYGRRGGGVRFGLPKPTKVVKLLLIANVAIFFLTLPWQRRELEITFIDKWFAVFPRSWVEVVQVWRLISYQFLHGGTFHILLNMLGLYVLGPTLERNWGSKKFLIFYLMCGVAGGVFYTLLVIANFLEPGPMVGASGAVLGLMAACAILFPHFMIIFLFFPVPIRLAAVILTGVYVVNLLTVGANAGGDAAHLAGMATGAIYVFSEAWRAKLRLKLRHEQWQKRIEQRKHLQGEVDRILHKVHQDGVHSLTSREKKILKKATEAERMKDML